MVLNSAARLDLCVTIDNSEGTTNVDSDISAGIGGVEIGVDNVKVDCLSAEKVLPLGFWEGWSIERTKELPLGEFKVLPIILEVLSVLNCFFRENNGTDEVVCSPWEL
jgi:hypothetical protein